MQDAIWIKITRARGSTPRDEGTAMMVTAETTEGTIGGGELEYRAIAFARGLLARGVSEVTRTFSLGPDLGQCCGGAVTLHFTRQSCATDQPPFRVHRLEPNRAHPAFLWIWGAGHVGRAVVNALHPQDYKITWIDSAPDRFPTLQRRHVTHVPAADMPTLATHAPTYAHHLIFTYSHDIDLALCAALLRRGAASIGLIGSNTKRSRFFKRLRALDLDPGPIICPIGDKSLGKRPESIATGVATQLLELTKGTARGDVA